MYGRQARRSTQLLASCCCCCSSRGGGDQLRTRCTPPLGLLRWPYLGGHVQVSTCCRRCPQSTAGQLCGLQQCRRGELKRRRGRGQGQQPACMLHAASCWRRGGEGSRLLGPGARVQALCGLSPQQLVVPPNCCMPQRAQAGQPQHQTGQWVGGSCPWDGTHSAGWQHHSHCRPD